MAKKKLNLYYVALGISKDEESRKHIVYCFAKELKFRYSFLGSYTDKALKDECLSRIRDCIDAVRVLTNPASRTIYDEIGHDAWSFKHSPTDVDAVEHLDWISLVLEEVLAIVDDMVSTASTPAQIRTVLSEILEILPQHIRGDRIARVDGLDAAVVANPMIDDFRAYYLESLPKDRIRFAWRVGAWEKSGQTVLGSCKAISKRDRQLQKRANPYLFEITLNLDYWLSVGSRDRQRVMHHELSHAMIEHNDDGPQPKIKPHDIEEMASTAIVFGAGNVYHLNIAKAMANHNFQPGVDGCGAQLRLFVPA